jgi:hypothetical protein
MSYTFHTVFNKELESVAILVHIKVSCMYFGNNVLDVESGVELWAFFQLKNNFLQVIVAWKH